MGVSVTGQALSFLGALALGAGVGALYDLFRILRVRVPLRGLGGVLDLLFWVTVTGALFLYSVTAGDGEVRAFLALAMLAGAAGYFRLLSCIFLRLGYWGADVLALLGKLCLFPLKLAADLAKKLWQKIKKDFHYRMKWYRMNFNIGKMGRLAQRDRSGKGGFPRHEDQKSRLSHKNRDSDPAHRRFHLPFKDAEPDR